MSLDLNISACKNIVRKLGFYLKTNMGNKCAKNKGQSMRRRHHTSTIILKSSAAFFYLCDAAKWNFLQV